MTGYGNIAKTKKDGSWIKYVFSLMSEKRIIKQCSRTTFELRFTEQFPKILEDKFGTLSGFFFSWARMSQKSPEIYLEPKSFRTIFGNEHQLIPWKLRFSAWLNRYIITADCPRTGVFVGDFQSLPHIVSFLSFPKIFNHRPSSFRGEKDIRFRNKILFTVKLVKLKRIFFPHHLNTWILT